VGRSVAKVLALPLAGASVVGVLAIHDATRALAPAARLALVAIPGSFLVLGAMLWSPDGARLGGKSVIRPRRLGEILPVTSPSFPNSRMPVSPIRGALGSNDGHTTRFSIRRSGSLVALVVASLVAAVSIGVGLNGLAAEELTRATFLAVVLTGPAVYVAARSLTRILLAHRAVTVRPDRITLGAALGYVPPLTIERHRLTQVLRAPYGGAVFSRQSSSIGLIVDDRVVHPLADHHFTHPDGLVEWIGVNRPEVYITPP